MGCQSAKSTVTVDEMMTKKGVNRKFELHSNATKEEFQKEIRYMFDMADENNDGVLEMEEFKQFTLNMLEAISDHQLGSEKEDLRSLF